MFASLHPLIPLLTALALGILCGASTAAIAAAATPVVAAGLWMLMRRNGAPRTVTFLTLLVLATAAIRTVELRPPPPLPPGALRDAQPRMVSGEVVEPPRRTEEGLRLLLEDVTIVDPTGVMRLDGYLVLHVIGPARTGPLGEGARIRAWATVSRVVDIPNPGVPSAASILLDRRILARGRADEVTVTGPGDSVFDAVRDRFRAAAEATDPLTSTLLEAMILGDQGRLDRERQERWRVAGITHILSISGLHVGVVALVIDRLALVVLGLIGPLAVRASVRRPAAVLGVLGGWAYVLVAGAPIAAVRSAWMITGLLGARAVLRHNTAPAALGLAALVSLLADPWALLDPSFQLSYVAVLALFAGARLCQRLDSAVADAPFPTLSRLFGWLLGALLTSALCTIATLPFILWHFGSVSVAGLITNVVAVPLSSVAVVIPGFLALSVAAVGLATPLLRISEWLVPWLEDIATWGAALGAIERPGATGPEVAAAALGAALLLSAAGAGGFPRTRLLVGSLALVLALVGLPRSRPDGLSFVFLAVGHGDATLIRLPDGRDLLVDGGGDPAGLRDVGRTIVVPALRALGVERLHAIVLSHPHPDHYRGLVAVAESLPVTEFWWTGQRSKDPEFLRLVSALEAQRTVWRTFSPDEETEIRFGEASLDILYPLVPADPAGAHIHSELGANDNSLVIRVRFGGFRALLTGDVEKAGEKLLLTAGVDLAADLLKVPHHGSRTSSTEAFLAAVHPQLAIAGSADQGRFAFPDPDVEARYSRLGIPLWITGRSGAVEVRTDGRTFTHGPAR